MGLIRFQPSRKPGVSFEIQQMTPTSSATFTIGEPVQRNSSNSEQIEPFAGGSTVTGLIGIAMAPVTSGTPAFGSTIPVARANVDTEFLGQIYDVSASAVATAAAATHEGNTYGIIEVNGEWYVDEEDTSDIVLTVQKVIPEWNAVLYKFISSAIGQ